MKSKKMGVVIAFMMLALLITSPLSTFAKEKEGKENKGNNNSQGTNSCFRAWGHLIAPGWIKHNGSIDLRVECHLPFGIGKKFHGSNASTTPDVTAPIISAISFKPAKTQADIRWVTDEKSDSTVFWNLSSNVDVSVSATNQIHRGGLAKDHDVLIRNLTAGTAYYVVVRSRDAAGNTTVSGVQSFTTNAPSPDTSAPTISNVVTLTSTSTVNVGWIDNEISTGRVFYSTTLPVAISGSSATFVTDATSTKNHTVTLASLNPSTTYYLVIEATDIAGNVSTSATFSARTGL